MTTTGDVWTYAEYCRLPDDGNKYEVLDGEVLMCPAPGTRHQHVATNLFFEVRGHVIKHSLGVILWDVDLLFVDGQFLRPDWLFVPASRRDGITDRGVEMAPDLVVEVLSPSSRKNDLVKKPRRYRDFGVPEMWVADPVRNLVHRFTAPGEDVVRDVLAWRPPSGGPDLEIDLAKVFAGF